MWALSSVPPPTGNRKSQPRLALTPGISLALPCPLHLGTMESPRIPRAAQLLSVSQQRICWRLFSEPSGCRARNPSPGPPDPPASPCRSVDLSPTRLHSLALHFRQRSSSLESQGKLLGSENDTGSPDFYTPRTRSSNGSDPMDDCSSCTSHSSSEHYYPAQMNANYSTLAEDSPSKARARQRQRQRAAGALGAANSGSMPNLAARGSGGGAPGVYLHSQSQPSSQYRIKEYPLYIEGGATPVVVRSLESDQEGHYSVKAQFKTSNSYTAGGLFRESWRASEEGDAGRLTPSRSQILGTPSMGREGVHDKGTGRTAVSDELRQWYQRSTASHKEHSRLSHTSSTSSDSGSQYSTSSQSTFLAHSRVTRMPQMCKATSGEREWGGRGLAHSRARPRCGLLTRVKGLKIFPEPAVRRNQMVASTNLSVACMRLEGFQFSPFPLSC